MNSFVRIRKPEKKKKVRGYLYIMMSCLLLFLVLNILYNIKVTIIPCVAIQFVHNGTKHKKIQWNFKLCSADQLPSFFCIIILSHMFCQRYVKVGEGGQMLICCRIIHIFTCIWTKIFKNFNKRDFFQHPQVYVVCTFWAIQVGRKEKFNKVVWNQMLCLCLSGDHTQFQVDVYFNLQFFS